MLLDVIRFLVQVSFATSRCLASMKVKQIRAVVRLVDKPPARTKWLPAGSRQAFEAMVKLLPKTGNFTVVWEEREVEAVTRTSAK